MRSVRGWRVHVEDYFADKRVFSCIYFFFNSLTGEKGCFQINGMKWIVKCLNIRKLAVIYSKDK